jgi:hypothetical protein
MPDSINARGFGFLRPRVMERATATFTADATVQTLATAPAGKKIYITELLYSNGGAAISKIALRFDSDSTDQIPFYCAANGGGLALNLLQSESQIGIVASTVKAIQTAGAANAVSVTIWYYVAD